MSSRADKALKAQKDKHHAILRELVQEVPNKTCADCLAKGKTLFDTLWLDLSLIV